MIQVNIFYLLKASSYLKNKSDFSYQEISKNFDYKVLSIYTLYS